MKISRYFFAFFVWLSAGAYCLSANDLYICPAAPDAEKGIIKEAAEFWTGPPHLESSMVFLKLGAGTEVKILTREASYMKVMHRNLIGYVEKRLVKVLPSEPQPASASPKALATNQKEQVKGEAVEISVLHTVTKETSLRAAADSQARVYVRLKEGYKVEVLEDSGRWWWKVRYKDRVGWAKRALLKKD